MVSRIGGLCAVFLFLVFARPAAAAAEVKPIDAIRGPVEEVLAILKDPAYKGPGTKTAQKDRLWEIIRRVFDFEAISERAVGRNWKAFSAEQKKVFSDAFAELLGNSYLDKIQGGFKNEKVDFLSQELLTDTKARVKTKIVREVDAIPVDYSVQKENGSWTIYDVNIEGVSLVQNYRTQFDQILAKESPDALIARVKSKNTAREKK